MIEPCKICGKKWIICDCEKEAKGSNSALSDGLSCLDGVEVTCIDKYRRDSSSVNKDEDAARVVIKLKFPEHLKLYYELKKRLAR